VIQKVAAPITFTGNPGTKDFPIQNAAKFLEIADL
jgi:hypothetical protein